MASIEDRWYREVKGDDGNTEKIPTDRHGTGKRWLVRWRDPETHASRRLSYTKWRDADNKRKDLDGAILHNTYVDPKAGTVAFDEYATEVIATLTVDPLTIQDMRGRLRRYVTGTKLGTSPIGKIRPSMVQAWIKGMTVSDNTKRVVFDNVSYILGVAVEDELISKNPCLSVAVAKPARTRPKIVPWTAEQVQAMREAISERYVPLVDLGAGLGLRPGESFGISPDDIDWLRRKVVIRRQVKLVGNRRVFAPPKGGKEREIPLAASLLSRLAAYLSKYPARPVTLPWREPGATTVTVELLVTTPRGDAIHSHSVTNGTWLPALDAAGITRSRENGAHALRHYFASALLAGGRSIKDVASLLGHADEGFTLKTYVHLMADSDDLNRDAIESLFSASCAPSVPRTGS